MKDYESEVCVIKHRVELSDAEIRVHLDMFDKPCDVKAVSSDGSVLVLVRFGDRLHLVNINGKLIFCFCHRDLVLTNIWFKQTLVSHTFFRTLAGYVVSSLFFI
jgi:hypothetical protein